MNYIEKLRKSVSDFKSVLCVGLDPDLQRIKDSFPNSSGSNEDIVLKFCCEVIEHTAPFACAFKANLAFFEALGKNGLSVFKEVVDFIPREKMIIADAKRGDIGNTASNYAKAFFEEFNVDAMTINPLMGRDTIEPYCHYPGKAVYVLTLTSNPGAKHYLRQCIGEESFSERIAGDISFLQETSIAHLGMVVGATNEPDFMEKVISRAPHQSLLIPGIGAQNGSVETLEKALENHSGIPVINSSRAIIYAGIGSDWASSVRQAAENTYKSLEHLSMRYAE